MKKLLIGVFALVLALLSVSCSKDESKLNGTYSFQYIHDVVYYFNDGSVYSLRENDELDEWVSSTGLDTDLSSLSFNFSGSDCGILYDGNLAEMGSYSLSGDRLSIRLPQSDVTLNFGYKTSPQTFFIWDLNTFRTFGADISGLTDIGATDVEMWVAMRQK